MKILMTGVSGLLGSEVWAVFYRKHELVAMGRHRPEPVPQSQWKECDLRDTAAVHALVTRQNPDLVIHCAAYNDVDGAEKYPEEAFRVNALGTQNLALACQRFDAVLLAVSTDYIFDGIQAPTPGYREFDRRHPLSIYAESKCWGEIHVQELLTKYYLVRTSWLFGPRRSTYADNVLEWASHKKMVPCLVDVKSAPTYTPDLARAFLWLVESGRFGVYHLTNSGFCSRLEFAREILKVSNLPDHLLKPITRSEFNHPAQRPAFSGLENLAWRLHGFPPLRPWKDALREYFHAKAETNKGVVR